MRLAWAGLAMGAMTTSNRRPRGDGSGGCFCSPMRGAGRRVSASVCAHPLRGDAMRCVVIAFGAVGGKWLLSCIFWRVATATRFALSGGVSASIPTWPRAHTHHTYTHPSMPKPRKPQEPRQVPSLRGSRCCHCRTTESAASHGGGGVVFSDTGWIGATTQLPNPQLNAA